jgi:hypothetical protein
MVGNLRLVLAVDVETGNEHTSRHCSPDYGKSWAIAPAMREQDWQDAGRRWQGKDASCTSSRQRRVVILRRSLGRSVALAQRDDVGQLPPLCRVR